MPHDDKIAKLSIPAELLFVRLISMSDDEGRFQASINGIIGFAFPRREITSAKVKRLLKEIVDQGMVVLYESDGLPYGVVRNFRKHQQINRPTPSTLPPPPDPDIVAANAIPEGDGESNSSLNNPGALPECSSPLARVGARRSQIHDPSPLEVIEEKKTAVARAKVVDQDVPPDDLAPALLPLIEPVLGVLADVQRQRGGKPPTVRGVGLALKAFPKRDHMAVVRQLEFWALAGKGQRKPTKDWNATYRTFLENADDADPPRPAGGVPALRPVGPSGGGRVSALIAEQERKAEDLRAAERADVIDGQEIGDAA